MVNFYKSLIVYFVLFCNRETTEVSHLFYLLLSLHNPDDDATRSGKSAESTVSNTSGIGYKFIFPLGTGS
jgi:hypothetical protein